MVATILSIGTELTRGEVLDRNGPMLASRLTAMGFEVRAICCVDDDVDRIAEALTRLSASASLLIATGGTGPSSDDHTVAAVARALGVGLTQNDAALQANRRHLDAHEKLAQVPVGAEVLGGVTGFASAFRVTLQGCPVYVLPGAPEQAERAADELLPRQLVRLATPRGASRVLRTSGVEEAALAERLRGVEGAFPDVRLALRPVPPEVEVRVIVREGDAAAARARVDAAAEEVRVRLGDVVFGEEDESLAAVVGRALRSRGYTLSVAESCTGGLIGAMLTAVPGSSDYLILDAVTYANAAKERVLGVEPEILRGHGAVSAECVRAMALGARRVSGADISVAVSGVAGPGGGSPDKPVGLVWIAVATDDEVDVVSRRFKGDRAAVQRAAAYAALELVRARCRGPLPARLLAVCG
jgi:nicotinamide-nucleotide amidase